MLRRFVEVGRAQQVYGGVGISKLLNLPIGFANSIVASLPIDYQGIRSLVRIHSGDRWIVLTAERRPRTGRMAGMDVISPGVGVE